jgi:myo-inositol 2-dehydrogenase/D-chiro-inositol 1-dehydrogenase
LRRSEAARAFAQRRPPRAAAWTATSISHDRPEPFFLERYRVAYAREMQHFLDALAGGKPVRTTIDDGVRALELAEAATASWREQRIVTF